jgi:hypothetical protein
MAGGGRIAAGTCVALGALAALLCIAPAAPAAPIGCTVADLESAIDDANANADPTTIELPAGCTYTLTTADQLPSGPTGLPAVTSPLTILGNAATLRRDPGAPPMRFFDVPEGGSLSLADLTLTGGTVASPGRHGGAISANCQESATPVLSLRRTTFLANGAGVGGAIRSCARFTVEDSLFAGNGAGSGGAMFLDGAGGVISNTAFTGNVADQTEGGAVLVLPGVAVLLRHVTVVGNAAATAGGGVVGTILQNSLVASNTPDNCATPIDAQGANLAFPASDTSCAEAEVTPPGDFVAGDPKLQPLAVYGGPTQSMRPLAGSAAVDAATGLNCPAADQRGKPRPVGAACDLGAVESEQDPPTCADAPSSGPFGAVQRIALSCSDPSGYPLTLNAVSGPSGGTLGAFGDAAVDYTPNAGFSGADAFTFQASNGFAAATATARVSVGAPPVGAPPPVPVDSTRPAVSEVAVTPRRFAVADAPTPRVLPAQRRVSRGAKFRFALSEPARVSLLIERQRPGIRLARESGPTCVAATRRNRSTAERQIVARLGSRARPRLVARELRRARCRAFVRRGVLQRDGATGAHDVRFTGRIGSVPLRLGGYRLVVTARDAAGNRSSPGRAAFTIVRG